MKELKIKSLGAFCRLQKAEHVLADFIFNSLRPKLLNLFLGRRLERRTSQVQSGAVLRVVPHPLRARPQDPLRPVQERPLQLPRPQKPRRRPGVNLIKLLMFVIEWRVCPRQAFST